MTIEQIYRLFLSNPRIETDSRKIEGGDIFFALKGEKFNGNQFASEALKRGAVCAFIDEEEFHRPGKTVLVENVLKTLQDLAHFHRKQLNLPIVAITGSNGKTTTKELIASVLASRYRVFATEGNLNNHIGVPLTLLQMDKTTEIGVVEMGANHPGEIGELCSIADPDFGIITNIGRAHLEGFGSFETIKKTKAELFHHLKKKKGIIFYNIENPVLTQLVDDYPGRVSFGEKNADFIGEPVLSPPFIHARVNFPKGALYLNTQLTGRYNFENVLAAACIGHYFKVDPLDIQAAIKKYHPQNNRSQLVEKRRVKIIMDAYNANPTSMQASIESFVSAFQSHRFLILGDMLELGSYSPAEHTAILEQIKKYTFEAVFLVGPLFSEAAKDYPFHTFPNSSELCQYLSQNPIKKGTVLVKGSRGIQLEKVLGFF
nr:UDP-N-acetylmuramoyl-tripeptide--D-alanyl-D-alanine ligase [Sunxiuqinia sp.]